jgi:S-formylglutathione hydrolase FrmB
VSLKGWRLRSLTAGLLAATALLVLSAGAYHSCAGKSWNDGLGRLFQGSGRGRLEYKTFHSAALGSDINYAVSLPPSYDQQPSRRYPVVIFLHGLFNNERDWERRGAEEKLESLRAAGKVGEYIVAIPYGANSFFLNGKDGTRYEDAVFKDFLSLVDQTYRTTGKRSGRVIEGLSMGGYGALVIAFKHPELFAGVAAHSAAIFGDLPKPPTSPDDMRGRYRYEIATKIFGSPPDVAFFQENNPLYLAKTNAANLKDLRIYFDVGEQDRYGFDAGNKQLDTTLTAAGVKHEFHSVPGEHGWPFLLARSEPAFTFCWNSLH